MQRVTSKHIIVILSIAVVIVSAGIVYKLYSIAAEDSSSTREYNSYKGTGFFESDMSLLEMSDDEIADTSNPEEESTDEVSFASQREIWKGINFAAFKNINNDFIGIINIPFFKMWYPMVQNSEQDADLYLTHSFNGEKNANGAIFLDYNFSDDFYDNHSIVFGHNMKNLTMFGSLHTLFDSDYKKPIYVYIYQPEQILVYEVFSAYTAEPESTTYNAFLVNSEHYEKYIVDAMGNAVYKHSDDSIRHGREEQSAILTLSTCHARDHSDYTVVQCMLIERIRKDEE